MKKLILKVVAGATLIAGVGVTSSCAKSNSLKNKTVDFVRLIDKALVVGGNGEYTTELYSRKQFLNLCEVTESSKNGVYNLTLALNKKYTYTPELYVCEATKDSITIYRTIARGEKTQYKITLLDNDEFTMEKHWCNLSVQKSGNIFSCIYTNEIEEGHSYNYSGTMNFNKGNAHISLVSAKNKEMQRYDLGITKGKINKIVRSSDLDNSGTMSVVSTFEISSDGKKATLDYSSQSAFLEEKNSIQME